MLFLRIAGYEFNSIVDGPNIRTTIFFQGCRHKCHNCHNPETWDINGGNIETDKAILEKITKYNHTKCVTFSGGDPVYQFPYVNAIAKPLYDQGYDLILYTGFTETELLNLYKVRRKQEYFNSFLSYFRYIVTGRYIEKLRNTGLKYRGSSNQLFCRFVNGNLINVTEEIDDE